MFYLISDDDELELPRTTCDTLKEAADWLGVSVQAVAYAIKSGCVVAGRFKVWTIQG